MGGGDQTVIVAVDHSPQAEEAVKYYLDKMHRRGNKLMLVHCVELPEMNRNVARDCNISPAVLAGMWKEEEAKSRVLEERMKQLLTNRGVSAKLRSCAGKPGEMICRIADEQDAGFIVTATRTRNLSGSGHRGSVGAALQHSFLGGVSDYLLRHAHCPVVVCKDEESIRRQRHASENKSRRRHQSAKAGSAEGSLASNLRRRFLSGGKESASMDAESGARKSLTGEEDAAKGGIEKKEEGGSATELAIKFHTSVQLYPTGGAGALAQPQGAPAVAVKN